MIVEPGMVVLLNGELAEVVGVINDPAAVIRVVGEEPCGCCGCRAKEATIVIGSNVWGEAVKPVDTLGDGSLLVAAEAALAALDGGGVLSTALVRDQLRRTLQKATGKEYPPLPVVAPPDPASEDAGK